MMLVAGHVIKLGTSLKKKARNGVSLLFASVLKWSLAKNISYENQLNSHVNYHVNLQLLSHKSGHKFFNVWNRHKISHLNITGHGFLLSPHTFHFWYPCCATSTSGLTRWRDEFLQRTVRWSNLANTSRETAMDFITTHRSYKMVIIQLRGTKAYHSLAHWTLEVNHHSSWFLRCHLEREHWTYKEQTPTQRVTSHTVR